MRDKIKAFTNVSESELDFIMEQVELERKNIPVGFIRPNDLPTCKHNKTNCDDCRERSIEALRTYNRTDHTHCPEKDSPCGIEGKHRCCICLIPDPEQLTDEDWKKAAKSIVEVTKTKDSSHSNKEAN